MDLAILYPVAGMSSRFNDRMKSLAKVGINGESLIECSVNQALKADFKKLIFVVNDKTEHLIKDIFGTRYRGVEVFYASQKFDSRKRDRPWGTLDALCSGLEFIDCPVVFCNGDDIYGEEVFKKVADHLRAGLGDVAIGYRLGDTLSKNGDVNRGVFKLGSEGYVTSLIEVFDINSKNLFAKGLNAEDLVSQNVFGFLPETVKRLNGRLEMFKGRYMEDRFIECLIPVEISGLVQEGLRIKLYPAPSKWYGITNPGDEVVIRNALKCIN